MCVFAGQEMLTWCAWTRRRSGDWTAEVRLSCTWPWLTTSPGGSRLASYKSGDRVPGELEMASTYGIARMTVARAIKELRDRELVQTVRGKGTFVL